MERITNQLNKIIKRMDWKDTVLMKMGVFSAGMVSGLSIPKKSRKIVLMVASITWVLSIFLLILRFMRPQK